MLCFFFFQAEDGIRDDLVTGVQTCALPIYSGSWVRTYCAGAGPEADFSSSSRPTMEIRPRVWSLSRSSLVQTILFWRSVPACGLLAARNGMATEMSPRVTANI